MNRTSTIPLYIPALLLILSAAMAFGQQTAGPAPKADVAGDLADEPVGSAGPAAVKFDIPRIEGLAVDASNDDWGDKGFRVSTLASAAGLLKPARDFDGKFRAAWNDKGLFLLVTVSDDIIHETDHDRRLFDGDCVEVCVDMQRGGGRGERYQLAIAPGVGDKHTQPRHCFFPYWNRIVPADADVEVNSRKREGGYELEICLPWHNLKVRPRAGQELSFQMIMFDSDRDDDVPYAGVWYPKDDSWQHIGSTQRLRLAQQASPPSEVAVRGVLPKDLGGIDIEVAAPLSRVGSRVDLRQADKVKLERTFAKEGDYAVAHFAMPLVTGSKTADDLSVWADGTFSAPVILPDMNVVVLQALLDMQMNFSPSVFAGGEFPPCKWANPALADNLLGKHTLTATVYDHNLNPVKSAAEPGWYGAVVAVESERQHPFRRFVPVYCIPAATAGSGPITGKVTTALSNTVLATYKTPDGASPDIKRMAADPALTNSDIPVLLTTTFGLDGQGNQAAAGNPWDHQRAWWAKLKRKVNAVDGSAPALLSPPAHVPNLSAAVLRIGTAEEAKVDPKLVDNLDRLFTKAVADVPNEPLNVCLARNGVIFFDRAYGKLKDGSPMTVATPSPMQSMSKPPTAVLMMMAVQQKVARLDDPLSKYFSSFKDLRMDTPLTIRHLFTHTSGLVFQNGGDQFDLEERVASAAHLLEVGPYAYSGTGFSLGGCVLELLGDDSLPSLYQRCILDPLKMSQTTARNAYSDMMSPPHDYAKLGQMLLNEGSYGDQMFFSPEVFKEMLPKDGWGPRGGIGLMWRKEWNLPEGTFGNTAYNSGTLCIDPSHQLVVVIGSRGVGRNILMKYYPDVFSQILSGVREPR
jgi:CubicO group peptidase (beta-lactamase class C family)